MNSFGEDELLIVAASILIIGLILKKNRSAHKNIRSCWVNPYLRQRNTKGRFAQDVRAVVTLMFRYLAHTQKRQAQTK